MKMRNYEVSIWTLQDSFITVLKPTNLEHKEAFQDGKITLQDDGENRITFSIPMYINRDGNFIENPLWVNKKNGYLITNLRKLKVIFNKQTEEEEIFEFLITKVTEKHEGFSKICEVEGEGLAFNELGKQGYKISFSADDVSNDVKDIKVSGEQLPKQNINYWMDKVLLNSNWRYSIQMDWSAADGIIDHLEAGATSYADLTQAQKDTLNNSRASADPPLRRHDKIYEDAYVAAWQFVSENDKTIIPKSIAAEQEKERIVEGSESNRYNLIQNIAETFGVYTKFKYYYDSNYHIIDREIIFYNNFLDENNVIDLTYGYESENISRELDSADVVTKMFVKSLDDDSAPGGLVSIINTEANKIGEDYILNFDYLYDTETISEEQYAAIKEFEDKMFELNQKIIPLDTEIIKLESELVDAEAARDNAKLLKDKAIENVSYFSEKIDEIYHDKGVNTNEEIVESVTASNPALITVARDQNQYIGKFGSQYSGVVPDSIVVKLTRNFTGNALKYNQNIEDNAVTNIVFSASVGSNIINSHSGFCYATFDYKPALEYIETKEKYQRVANDNQTIYDEKVALIDGDSNGTTEKARLGLTTYIQSKKDERQIYYDEKILLTAKFENMMGPALREGNWQPQDEYANYGEQYDEEVWPTYSSSSILTNSENLEFIWDSELFDNEEKNYYESGIEQTKVYYPCIKLTNINGAILTKFENEEFLNGLTFVYKEHGSISRTLMPQGTNCRLGFVQANSGGEIIPVLLLTNLYSTTKIIDSTSAATELDRLQHFDEAYLAYATPETLLGEINSPDNDTIFAVSSGAWLENPQNYRTVFPRLKSHSDYLRTRTNEIFFKIYRKRTVEGVQVLTYLKNLEEFKDYSILERDEKKFITFKPEVFLCAHIGYFKIRINYCISNTALQVYLDAIKVMKENAYPKVSYTIDNIVSENLVYDTYKRLGQLAHINDAELKLNGAMGYISAVELSLDKPWEDSITIKNYKNKFEDLFSTIVAQTESMQKNAYRLTMAANAFSPNGNLIAPIAPESLLSSAEVFNTLIKNNANVISANAVSEAAINKAILASTDVYRVMHGEMGLAFSGNNIEKVLLNKDVGLYIEGMSGDASVIFKVTNNAMGFFKTVNGTTTPQLYFENGDLAISGTMYAKTGWFGDENGWIIGDGATDTNAGSIKNKIQYGIVNNTEQGYNWQISNSSASKTIGSTSNLGGLLYSANGKAIFTAGTTGANSKPPMIVLNRSGFSSSTQTNDAVFLFDGTSLFINGTISTAAGLIGGWYIGQQHIGSSIYRADCKVGMSSLHGVTEPALAFWAGGDNPRADANSNLYLNTNKIAFCVWEDGAIKATKGTIGGWTIGTYQLNAGSSTSYVGLNAGVKDATNNPNGDYAFWAGSTTPDNAVFSVKKSGVITAKSGKIGGWTISNINANSGYIGSGPSRGQSRVGMSVFPDDDSSYDYYAAFWAGADIAENAQFQISNAKFQVTQTGTLTATDAHITGEITATSGSFTGVIKARSGEIGASNGNKIIIGGVNETNNNRAYIYSGSKSTKTANQNGFYIGTDGIALGQTTTFNNITISKFQVNIDGTLYATNANISGKIIATSGSIGSLNINSDGLVTTITENNVSRTSVFKATGLYGLVIGSSSTSDYTNAPFRVTNTGQLTATGANITGEITATSGSFTGIITANGGNIGGWTIKPKFDSLENATVYDSLVHGTYFSTADMGIFPGAGSNAIVLWIGGKRQLSYTTNGNTASEIAPFRITREGKLYATGAEITGTITASSGKIGDWNINNGNDQGLSCTITENNVSRTSAFKAGGTYGLVIGSPSSSNYNNAPFKVTNTGELTAVGATITNGKISLTDATKTYTGELSSSQFKLETADTNKSFKIFTSGTISDIGGISTYTEDSSNSNISISTVSKNITGLYINNLPFFANYYEEETIGNNTTKEYTTLTFDATCISLNVFFNSMGVTEFNRIEMVQNEGIQIKSNYKIRLDGTTLINGHRLYFHDSNVPSSLKDDEEDIYLFSRQSTPPDSGWEKVTVYRKTRSAFST